jgi:hypothetical protein
VLTAKKAAKTGFERYPNAAAQCFLRAVTRFSLRPPQKKQPFLKTGRPQPEPDTRNQSQLPRIRAICPGPAERRKVQNASAPNLIAFCFIITNRKGTKRPPANIAAFCFITINQDAWDFGPETDREIGDVHFFVAAGGKIDLLHAKISTFFGCRPLQAAENRVAGGINARNR